jgi:hypothetical protein
LEPELGIIDFPQKISLAPMGDILPVLAIAKMK